MKQILLSVILFVAVLQVHSQTSYTWNGSASTAWATPGNWTPNGVPGSADNVTIVTGGNTCSISAATIINNLTLTSGTLDLGGSTLTVNGTNAQFTSGTVQNGALTVSGATTTNFGTSAGTPTMNCAINVTSAAITTRNTTFQGNVVFTKTGASNDASSGNNNFTGTLTVNNGGAGYFLLGNNNPDQFNISTFNNLSGGTIYVAYNSTGNVFNGVTTFNNTPTANQLIYVSWYSSGTLFNDNIIVSSTGGQGIQFCGGNFTATSTLTAGKTVSIGPGGFSGGTLSLRQFIQLGASPETFNLTGAAIMTFGPFSTFGGDVTASSPTMYLNGATFNGASTFTKTGSSGDYSSGGNIFNGICNINNSGTSYFLLGNSKPDTWNSDVTFTNTGSERILPCWATAGNQFNGNIFVNTSGSAQGVQFCGGNTTATATLASGMTIQAGSGGLTAGYLYLKQFTQLGNVPIILNATGTSVLYLGPNSNFGGAFVASAPDIWAQGATYNSPAIFTKTGGSSNHNNQNQNIFNSTVTINQQSNTGYFMLGYNSNDLFNDNITVNGTGTGGIYLGWTGGTGTPTLASGKTILVGAGGFNAGFLSLNTFTQLGNAPMNLTFTGTNTYINFARGSVIGGNLATSSPDVYMSTSTFNGSVNITKTGAGSDASGGGNTFQASTTFNNTASGYIILGNGNPDVWNSDVTFNSSGSSYIYTGWNSAGNQFNGNITVTSTGSSTGIYFNQAATSTATLAAGSTMQIGAAGFTNGTLLLRQFTQAGNAPINLTLTGATTLLQVGPSSVFGGSFTAVSPRLLLNGAVYNDVVSLTKTGATGEWSNGGNTFNSTLIVNHQGAGYFGFANGAPDIYNGDVYANNIGTERIIFGNNPVGNQFNGNIILTQTGSGVGIAFGWSATTNETMAAGKTISIGAAGFSTGYLQIERFTQLGNVAVNLPLTGNASLTFGPTSAFGGDVTASSASMYLNGCTFNGAANLTKTGATGDYSAGGNVFNGLTSITNSGSSYFLLGNSSPDIWNNDVTFTDNGSERLLPCWATAGNQFNGNIYVNTSGSASGIQFCGGNGTATATLAAGKSISSGTGGLNAGYLILKQFTQLGNVPVNLTMSSTATYLQFGPSSALGGDVISTSPGLFFNGCTFGGAASCIKTGASNDASSGNNTFNGVATMTNTGSGYLLFGNGNRDQFNTAATFNNLGSAHMYVAYNSASNIFGGITTFNNSPTANNLIYVSQYSAGTVFNDNVIVTSTFGQGVQFCTGNTTATATLAAGKTISIGAAGFSAGTLLLRQFTQTGTTAQNLTLTGTGSLIFGPSSAFGGDVTTVSPTLFFGGCNFAGMVNSIKNGPSSDASAGNNTFGGAFTITNTGAGYFLMGNGNPDTWQSTSTFNNFSTGQHMYVAYNSTGNTFNGDVTFNNQPASTGLWIYANNTGINTQFNGNIIVSNNNGGGVYFGNGTGTATLSGSVSVGAGGFNSGGLIFRNFTQASSGAAQNITTTGTSYIQFGTLASFAAPVTTSSPGIFFNGCTFAGVVNSTKTGSSSDQSQGSNTFNAAATFTNNGTGYLLMTASTTDVYNGDVTFLQNSTGPIYPNYNGNSTYAGNITVGSPSATAMTFGSNTGTATLIGTGVQNMNGIPGSATPVFTRLVVNNTGGGVTLNSTSINVSKTLTLNTGLLKTTTAYILTMMNGSVTAAGDATSTSYVNGPMRYQKSTSGVSTLNFPIGTSPDCRPVILTVNHGTGTLYTYTAQLFNASARKLNYTLPPSVDLVSNVHYYTIGRADASGTSQPTAGLSGNQTIQIFFGSNDTVSNGGTLTIVKNTYLAPTAWINIGGSGGPAYSGGANLTGSITSTSSPTAFNSFSTFALGDQVGGGNILPIGLLNFDAKADKDRVDLRWTTSSESNNSYFTIEKSFDAINFSFLENVNTLAINGNSSTPLNYLAFDMNPYAGMTYYRLKQTDLDGKSTYSGVVSVSFDKKKAVAVYPNPTTGTVYISGLDANQSTLAVEWLDVSGKSLARETMAVQNGMVRLDTHFRNGVYFLKFMSSDGNFNIQNVVIMK